MRADFLSDMAGDKWGDTFEVLKEKIFQPIIL